MVRLGLLACASLALSLTPALNLIKVHNVYFDLQMIIMAADLFETEYGYYPDPDTWMLDLLGDSESALNTKQLVFIDFVQEDFQDSWGEAYQYYLKEVDGKTIPHVYSKGKDKHSATMGNDPDDISSWREINNLDDAYPTVIVIHLIELLVWVIVRYVILRFLILRWKRRKKDPVQSGMNPHDSDPGRGPSR